MALLTVSASMEFLVKRKYAFRARVITGPKAPKLDNVAVLVISSSVILRCGTTVISPLIMMLDKKSGQLF